MIEASALRRRLLEVEAEAEARREKEAKEGKEGKEGTQAARAVAVAAAATQTTAAAAVVATQTALDTADAGTGPDAPPAPPSPPPAPPLPLPPAPLPPAPPVPVDDRALALLTEAQSARLASATTELALRSAALEGAERRARDAAAQVGVGQRLPLFSPSLTPTTSLTWFCRWRGT